MAEGMKEEFAATMDSMTAFGIRDCSYANKGSAMNKLLLYSLEVVQDFGQ